MRRSWPTLLGAAALLMLAALQIWENENPATLNVYAGAMAGAGFVTLGVWLARTGCHRHDDDPQ